MTGQYEIAEWAVLGKEFGATHMLVVTDTFDWSDYPVFVSPESSVVEMVAEYAGKPMSKVMEVYDLTGDLLEQLGETKAWHL